MDTCPTMTTSLTTIALHAAAGLSVPTAQEPDGVTTTETASVVMVAGAALSVARDETPLGRVYDDIEECGECEGAGILVSTDGCLAALCHQCAGKGWYDVS